MNFTGSIPSRGGRDIVQPSSFAEMLANAPTLHKQGGNLSDIPRLKYETNAQLIGNAANSAAAIEQQQIGADMRLQIAQLDDASARQVRRATILANLAPLLSSGGGSRGGSQRMAAGRDFATGLLANAMRHMSPTGLITDFTDFTKSLNDFNLAARPWNEVSRKGASEALAWLRG